MKFFVDTLFKRGASRPAAMVCRTLARASVSDYMAVKNNPQLLQISLITVVTFGLDSCLLFHLFKTEIFWANHEDSKENGKGHS